MSLLLSFCKLMGKGKLPAHSLFLILVFTRYFMILPKRRDRLKIDILYFMFILLIIWLIVFFNLYLHIDFRLVSALDKLHLKCPTWTYLIFIDILRTLSWHSFRHLLLLLSYLYLIHGRIMTRIRMLLIRVVLFYQYQVMSSVFHDHASY